MQFDKIISFFFILYENFLKKKKHEIMIVLSVMIVNLNDSCFCIKKYKLQR